MIKCRTGFNPCGIFYGLIGRGGEMGVENKEGSKEGYYKLGA